jgi:hypothetical protein
VPKLVVPKSVVRRRRAGNAIIIPPNEGFAEAQAANSPNPTRKKPGFLEKPGF